MIALFVGALRFKSNTQAMCEYKLREETLYSHQGTCGDKEIPLEGIRLENRANQEEKNPQPGANESVFSSSLQIAWCSGANQLYLAFADMAKSTYFKRRLSAIGERNDAAPWQIIARHKMEYSLPVFILLFHAPSRNSGALTKDPHQPKEQMTPFCSPEWVQMLESWSVESKKRCIMTYRKRILSYMLGIIGI